MFSQPHVRRKPRMGMDGFDMRSPQRVRVRQSRLCMRSRFASSNQCGHAVLVPSFRPATNSVAHFCNLALDSRRSRHGQRTSDRGFFRRWSSYNNFALDKATIATCLIQTNDLRLAPAYWA